MMKKISKNVNAFGIFYYRSRKHNIIETITLENCSDGAKLLPVI